MSQSRIENLEAAANQARWQGNLAEARLLRTALEQLHDQVNADPLEQTKNLNKLAFLSIVCGEYSEAIRAAEKCLWVYGRTPTQREDIVATYLMMLACALAEAGRFDEAVSHGEEAVGLFERILGTDSDFVRFRKVDVQSMCNREVRCYIQRQESAAPGTGSP